MREDVHSHFGTWWAVAAWIVLFGAFILFVPFYKKADRKPAGAFLAFVVAFALEMFGAPLSLYFVAWAFGRWLPEGLLWGHTLVGSIGMAGHYIYLGLVAVGAVLVIAGWARIHRDYWSKDEGEGKLVREGLYRHIRHPQYSGFLLISLGAIFEWATIPLLVLWPCLLVLYVRLALKEEAEMRARFGIEWEAYAERTGMFLPRLFRRQQASRNSERASGKVVKASRAGALALAALFALAPRPAQALTWSSYAEAGLGLSLSGGSARPLLSLESGLLLGPVELGSFLAILPLEFGSPDLVRAGALHYGASLGARLPIEGLPFAPYGKLALGGVAVERAEAPSGDPSGHPVFDGLGARRSFSASLVIGLELPLGDRFAARAWGAYRFAPDSDDLAGGGLSGPDFGLSLRATWETTIR